jgi:hypothetical protein
LLPALLLIILLLLLLLLLLPLVLLLLLLQITGATPRPLGSIHGSAAAAPHA